jgi:hypothetical protein
LFVVVAGICVLLEFATDVEPFVFTARLGAAEPGRDAGQTPAPGGGRVVVDRKRIMRGRFDEVAAKLESDNALERQVAAHWLGGTEWPDAQAERAVQLLCQLLEFPDRYPRETIARAIQNFACLNPSRAARAVDALVKALAKAREEPEELRQELELADALGAIGPAAAPAVPSLQSLLPSTHSVIQIHAATALLRIQPSCREAFALLLNALSRGPGDCWRAADGLRQVGPAAKSATPVLRRLLRADDVRVRVTCAGALWAVEGDADSVLPTLIQALQEPDLPLSTEFIYPSFSGDSHRAYVARRLSDMGTKASAAVPALVATIKETTSDGKPYASWKAVVGISAMRALPKLGPAARAALPTIRELDQAQSSWFEVYHEIVSETIAALENSSD